jgi:hypothetical protein
MSGNSSITGDQSISYTDNISFDGTHRGGAMTTDGQLWIGATASDRANNGGHVRLGNLTSLDGSIGITTGPGQIDLSAAAPGFQPNAVLQEFDDFLSGSSTGNNTFNSKLQWQGNFSQTDGTSANPGIISWGPNAGSSDIIWMSTISPSSTNLNGPIQAGGGQISISWIAQMTSLSGAGNTFNFDIGLCDTLTAFNFSRSYVNACYFTYTDTVNGGNWQIKCTNSSVTTTVNTSVAATTNFTTFTIVINSVGTNVSFYIDNVIAGTITTNIPTAAITPFFQSKSIAGTRPVMNIDLFWITINLTTPRPGPIPAISNGSFAVNTQVFTASGNYIPIAGMKYCIIEAVGGGGGGGGSVTQGGAFSTNGGGGGAGGYSRKTSTASSIGVSQTVIIGAAGTAGTSGNNAGGNGGDTSVGTICIAKGGTGGSGNDGGSVVTGGAGGIPGTGDFTFSGGHGEDGSYINNADGSAFLTAAGGSSFFGAGGASQATAVGSVSGYTGQMYGGGGSGGTASATGNVAGAAGAAGAIVITEYLSLQGANSNPSSGDLVLIQSQTASGSSGLTFTTGISSTYDVYYLTYYDVTLAGGDGSINMQYSINGGSSYISSASYAIGGWGSNSNGASGVYAIASGTAFLLEGAQTDGTIIPANGKFYLYGLSSSILNQTITGATFSNQAGTVRNTDFSGQLTNTAAVNALQIFPGAGTFSGTFKLYGIVN